MTRLHNATIDYSSELKYKLDADKLLATKMLLLMDQDIRRWLKECERFKTREEVNGIILDDLPDIVTDVCKSRFSLDLPSIFNSISMPEDVPQGPFYKRRRIGNTANIPEDNDRRKVVKTPTPNEEYKLRDGKDFGKLYGGQNDCHRVNWPGGKKMCPCFHSKMYCFDNCNNICSKPHSPIPSTSQQDRNYKRFLKKIRSDK